MPNIDKSSFSRVFILEDRAGPATTPQYMGWSRAMGFSWPQGDVTPVRVPSEDQYSQFEVIDEIRGEGGLPSLPIQARYPVDLSDYLRLVRKGCRLDYQVHIGECRAPTDFDDGWDKILVLEAARITDYSTGELGALDAGEEALVLEDISLTGLDAYEVKRLMMSEFGEAEAVQEVIAVALCDARTCGECGLPSDGCQKIFAVTVSTGASPGLPAEVIYSSDQGQTLGETIITSLGANEDPSDMSCVGTYLAVVSSDSDSLHYALIANVLTGTEVWAETTVGFVVAGPPNAICSQGLRYTWVVGDAGYVYFSADITASVTVQDAGVATVEDLQDVHAYDKLNVLAVGNNNAVVFTRNGGQTWTSITGPAPAVVLRCCWMRTENEWMVGDDAGQLWYTRDGGATWTEKAFPSSGNGSVQAIWFSTPTVGYLAYENTVTNQGIVLRTINGGNSWYGLPEDNIDFPANDRINDVVGCGDDVNFVFAGGLADDALDGILLRGA